MAVLDLSYASGSKKLKHYEKVKGQKPSIATFQISTLESALVFQILLCSQKYSDFRENSYSYLPLLHKAMSDPSIVKVSIEILHDTLLISDQYGIDVCGRVDIAGIDSNDPLCFEAGLARLSLKYLGTELPKPQDVRLSDWELQTFTNEQAIYAALDAWICIPLFNKVKLVRPYTVDETTPREGKKQWQIKKNKIKRQRQKQKRKDKYHLKKTIDISEKMRQHDLWNVFVKTFIIQKRSTLAHGVLVDMASPSQILVSSKEESSFDVVKKMIRNLQALMDLETERGPIKFQVVKITGKVRNSRFTKGVLDLDGIQVEKSLNRKKMSLHTKLVLIGMWLEKKRNSEDRKESSLKPYLFVILTCCGILSFCIHSHKYRAAT